MDNLIMLGVGLVLFGLGFLVGRGSRSALLRRMAEALDGLVLHGTCGLTPTQKEGSAAVLQNSICTLEGVLHHQRGVEQAQREQINSFTENLAHQMNTVVTALQLRLDLAAQRNADPRVEEELRQCNGQADRLRTDLDYILKSSQLSSGKITLRRESCSMAQVMEWVAEELSPLLQQRSIHLETHLSGTPMGADPFWLCQAAENLVKNAAQFAHATVWVTEWDQGNRKLIEIQDDGDGIPPAELPHLFDRFYRGGGNHQGYGIGLHMAKEIIDAHHGTLEVKNHPSGGAVFTIALPWLEGVQAYEVGMA